MIGADISRDEHKGVLAETGIDTSSLLSLDHQHSVLPASDCTQYLLCHPLSILPLISQELLNKVAILARVVNNDYRLLIVDFCDVLHHHFKQLLMIDARPNDCFLYRRSAMHHLILTLELHHLRSTNAVVEQYLICRRRGCCKGIDFPSPESP